VILTRGLKQNVAKEMLNIFKHFKQLKLWKILFPWDWGLGPLDPLATPMQTFAISAIYEYLGIVILH